VPLHVFIRRPRRRLRRAPRWLIEDGPGRTGALRFLTTILHAYRMHVQREFPISSVASDLRVCWAGRAHAVASKAIETVIEAFAASRRAGRPPRKEITVSLLPSRGSPPSWQRSRRSAEGLRPRTCGRQTELRMGRPTLLLHSGGRLTHVRSRDYAAIKKMDRNSDDQ
jgi:hypothetical protein